MKAERVVLDTNVLISAAIMPAGKARQVLDRVRRYGELLISPPGLVELSTRLRRKKFDRYLSADSRSTFVADIESVAAVVTIQGNLRVCRDPDDDAILETALDGRADCLVTGDRDLLALRQIGDAEAPNLAAAKWRSVAIVRPAEFLLLTDDRGT